MRLRLAENIQLHTMSPVAYYVFVLIPITILRVVLLEDEIFAARVMELWIYVPTRL